MDPRLMELGLPVASLTVEQRRQLDEQGYAILPGLIDSGWLGQLRRAFDDIYDTEGEAAGKEAGQMEGARRLADLVNKGEVFDRIYQHPLLLAAVWHILQRPFKLHSVNGHEPLPGAGQQHLHADWGGARDRGIYHVVNSMWMLDDMTAENGATRLVPGSHLNAGSISELVADCTVPHSDEVCLAAPAGSVGVFNGSAWHSCTQNRCGARRRVLHGAFIAREHEQQTDQRAHLRPETEARLSPLGRYVLDV